MKEICDIARARRVASIAAACVMSVTLLSSCAGIRNNLGTNSADCYTSLPTAVAAVHDAGHLVGVRLVTTSSLRGHHQLFEVVGGHARSVKNVCLVAYAGSFSKAAVSAGIGSAHGRRAVVVIVYPGNRLLATVISAKLPIPFGHSHLGV